MTRLPVLVSLVVLLGALCAVVPTPLVWAGALFIVAVIAVAFVARWVGGKRLWMPARVALGVGSLAAFAVLLFASPTLVRSYTPALLKGTPEVVAHRGFYAAQSDGTDTGYHWTQNRATLVLDFLVRKPVTIAVEMRSAAVAGGPDRPVAVEVNGEIVGELQPAPHDIAFQTLPLRFVPRDWGGDQTEIRLLPASFQPGMGDNRTLGTMVRSITVDKTEAWGSLARWRWLVWSLPLAAAAAIALRVAAQRTGRRRYGHLSVALCGAGVAGAVGVAFLMYRVGTIDRTVTFLWYVAAGVLAVSFALAAVTSPLGAPADANLLQRAGAWARPRAWAERLRPWVAPPVLPPDTIPTGRAWRLREVWRDAALVAVFAFAVRVVWVLLIPPHLAPDETDHYVYVTHIAEQANMPQITQPQYPFYSKEVSESAELTLAGKLSPAYSGRNPPDLPHYPVNYDYEMARQYRADPADRYSSGGGRATGYPPLYYLTAAAFYKPFQDAPVLARLFAVRGAAAFFGAATCAVAYLLGYALRGTRPWGVALGASAALMPMFVFDAAIANNDAALNCFATALILLLVLAWQRRGLSGPLAFGIGLVSGLVMLSKPTAFFLVALAGAFVLLKGLTALRVRMPARRSVMALVAPPGLLSGRAVRDVARAYLLCAAGLLIGFGPWIAFRVFRFGDFGFAGLGVPLARRIAATAGVSLPPVEPVAEAAPTYVYPLSAYVAQKVSYGGEHANWMFIQTVWGYFGWLDEAMPPLAYGAITFATVIGLIGVGLQLVLQGRRRPHLLFLIAIVLAHTFALFFIVEYYDVYRKSGSLYGIQGRYLFPVVAPWLFLLLSGWHYLLGERAWSLRIGMLGMFAIQLVGVATLLTSYYGLVFLP